VAGGVIAPIERPPAHFTPRHDDDRAMQRSPASFRQWFPQKFSIPNRSAERQRTSPK
jgi:hypothetical protein